MNKTTVTKKRFLKGKLNKVGFTMLELIGAMIIIAILTIGGIIAITSAINNSRMSALQSDLAGFRAPIEQFLLENPQYAKTATTYNNPEVLTALNEYLEGEMKIDLTHSGTETEVTAGGGTIAKISAITPTTVVATNRMDPWKTRYKIYVNPDNLTTEQAGKANWGKKAAAGVEKQDSELRIFIVSNAKNTTTGTANNTLDGIDDSFLMVEYVNGRVSHGYYNLKDGNTNLTWGTPTAKTDIKEVTTTPMDSAS